MEKIKTAIIFNDEIYNRKGVSNAVINRIKYLKKYGIYEITVYCIVPYENWIVRKLKHSKKIKKDKVVCIDGVTINILFQSFSIIDYILQKKLHVGALFENVYLRKISRKLKDFDLISAHSTASGYVALMAHKKYGIPYCVTWHGSDIHTFPFSNQSYFNMVKNVMGMAEYNFFVSKALMVCSDEILCTDTKKVLYNGVSDRFYRYDDESRQSLRNRFDVEERCKVVAFVGNLFPIKNADLLPKIFSSIISKYNQDVIFWIIGDGKLRNKIETEIKSNDAIHCVFFGNQPAESIPDYLNCVDVLILPSKNEGLPLVTVEALKCGANVVGSNVGGISEAIGAENVFELDDNFIENITNRVVYMLNNEVKQVIPSELSWSNTAQLENTYYLSLLNKSK